MRPQQWIAIAGLFGLAGCYSARATPLASDERLARTGLAKGDGVASQLISYEHCRVPDPVSEGECEAGPRASELATRIERCLAEQLGDTPVNPASRVRYRLALRVRTAEGGFPTGGAAAIGWMIGRYEQRITEIDVDVLDAERAATLGRITAKAYGASGWGVLFVLNVLPVPMLEDAPTEAAACTAMARAVATFLEDPEPRKWIPELEK